MLYIALYHLRITKTSNTNQYLTECWDSDKCTKLRSGNERLLLLPACALQEGSHINTVILSSP